MEYFEVPEARPGEDGICSDNDCPCGFPGAAIPRGSGYMYISESVVDFRRDARTLREAEQKVALMQQRAHVLFDQNVITSTLMCKQGASKRGLDLEVAAADARHWWETGLVPLRATPLAGK
jgi:ribosomal protein L24E